MIVPRAARALVLVGALAAAGVAGCSIKNPDFCCSSLDSCSQVGVSAITGCDDPAEPFCDDEGLHGPARACIADPSTNSCTGPDDCPTAALPVCDADGTGTCTGCAIGDDCTRFAATPLCDTGSGTCVACRISADCSGANPVCGADHTCRPCTADAECAAGVCSQAGTCPPTENIIYVDTAAPAGNAACTSAAPCHTITAGVAVVTAARKYIKLIPGMFTEQVLIDGRAVEIDGLGSELTSTLNPVVDVRNGANLTLAGLRIRNATGRGLRCADPTTAVALRGVGVENSALRGVESTDCTLTIERSRILGNVGGGVLVTNGRSVIRNSFIGKNGSGTVTQAGITISNPTDLTLEFNTIADNLVGNAAFAAGLSCQTSTPVIVANNIVVGLAANQIDAVTCAPTYTLSNEAVPGTGNLTGQPTFRNAGAGDFHLAAGSMGIDVADPAATVTTDIDGEARANGGRSDLGADELH